jgi:DNA-binding response OmpR family regulator
MNERSNPSTIMIVDDTPANLKLLLELLREKGHRVVAFPSGAQALIAAAANPPDLILLDIWMPEMDGFEVCRRLKANEVLRDIPVLFLSALIETADKVRAFALGGADYVTKPFQPEEVHARVLTHLQNRSLQRQLRRHNDELEQLVAERNAELAQAHQRLQELSRLKDDFLRMISHEIRTPANGVLATGGMLAELCPASEESALYGSLFHRSSARLLNLITDATMLAEMDRLTRERKTGIPFSQLFAEVLASLPDVRVAANFPDPDRTLFLRGEPHLLKQALATTIRLASYFCRDRYTVPLTRSVQDGRLCLHFALDDLKLATEPAADYFRIDSTVRSASCAEQLGLAPVVAHQIVTAFGGEMSLVKKVGSTGAIEVALPM